MASWFSSLADVASTVATGALAVAQDAGTMIKDTAVAVVDAAVPVVAAGKDACLVAYDTTAQYASDALSAVDAETYIKQLRAWLESRTADIDLYKAMGPSDKIRAQAEALRTANPAAVVVPWNLGLTEGILIARMLPRRSTEELAAALKAATAEHEAALAAEAADPEAAAQAAAYAAYVANKKEGTPLVAGDGHAPTHPLCIAEAEASLRMSKAKNEFDLGDRAPLAAELQVLLPTLGIDYSTSVVGEFRYGVPGVSVPAIVTTGGTPLVSAGLFVVGRISARDGSDGAWIMTVGVDMGLFGSKFINKVLSYSGYQLKDFTYPSPPYALCSDVVLMAGTSSGGGSGSTSGGAGEDNVKPADNAKPEENDNPTV